MTIGCIGAFACRRLAPRINPHSAISNRQSAFLIFLARSARIRLKGRARWKACAWARTNWSALTASASGWRCASARCWRKGSRSAARCWRSRGPAPPSRNCCCTRRCWPRPERPTVEAIRKLARETGAASEGELALAESPSGGRVLALEEELLAQEGWRGAGREGADGAGPAAERACCTRREPGFGGDAGAGPEGGERAFQRGGDRAAEARRAGRARRRRARLGAPQARLRADQRAGKRRHLPARAARFGRAGPQRGDESHRVARLQPRHGRRDPGALRRPRRARAAPRSGASATSWAGSIPASGKSRSPSSSRRSASRSSKGRTTRCSSCSTRRTPILAESPEIVPELARVYIQHLLAEPAKLGETLRDRLARLAAAAPAAVLGKVWEEIGSVSEPALARAAAGAADRGRAGRGAARPPVRDRRGGTRARASRAR